MSKIGKNVKALTRLEMSRLLKSEMNRVFGGQCYGCNTLFKAGPPPF